MLCLNRVREPGHCSLNFDATYTTRKQIYFPLGGAIAETSDGMDSSDTNQKEHSFRL